MGSGDAGASTRERFRVQAPGEPPLTVDASNWMQALGIVLAVLEADQEVHRLACEVMSNGRVLARDALSGQSFVIDRITEPIGETTLELAPSDVPTAPGAPPRFSEMGLPGNRSATAVLGLAVTLMAWGLAWWVGWMAM